MASAQENATSNSGGVQKFFPIIFAVVNLLVMGGGAFLVYKGTLGRIPPSISDSSLQAERKLLMEELAKEPLIFTMDTFTINLDGEPKRTIRLEINFEMAQPEGIEELMDMDNRVRARDQIISILHEKTYADLETLQGKLFLKDSIVSAVNHVLSQTYVKDVYFTEFIVQ